MSSLIIMQIMQTIVACYAIAHSFFNLVFHNDLRFFIY